MKHDIRGKSLDQVMAISEAQVRQLIESKLLDYEDVLRSQGATPTEFAAEMERARADMEASISENLARLRAWLARGGESLN